MMKSLANKIHLKESLYTFCIAEGAPVQKHLNEFNSILADLESLDARIEEKDKAILLVVALAPLINTLRRSCYIVILILYRLRMLSQACCLRKSLILTFMLILLNLAMMETLFINQFYGMS